MATTRDFCRFNPDPNFALAMSKIPEAGFCLSAFVLITPPGRADRVLMGHLNPAAPWDQIGALDPARAEMNRKGWMLPSCHFIYSEGPQAAAHRIANEQLELDDLSLSGPQVVSESYPSARRPELLHWDLEFIFRGELAAADVPKPAAWTELAFVDLRRTPKADIARSHEDVIESAGLRFGAP